MGFVPSAFILDVTRLTSRLGRGALTGIDRVEAAYLDHLTGQDLPVFGLLRTGLGFVLISKAGCRALADLVAGRSALQDLPFWAGGAKPSSSILRGAFALRAHWVRLRPKRFLPSLLACVPAHSAYLNVGHSNLTPQVFSGLRRAGLRSMVLIHDTIPLDYPHLTRAGHDATFAAKIKAVALGADVVTHISHDARTKTEVHFAAAGRVPQGITAHLGVDLAAPTPPPFAPTRPYFVALGTVEPRKNLGLLLDIWKAMGADDPQLLILGHKGWAAPALFDQITHLQARGTVLYGENLSDGAVASLMQGAIALLFPSLAEGFGLPPLEAAGRGIPVVASNLAVLRETCSQFPVYLEPSDSYSWMETIQSLTRKDKSGRAIGTKLALPTWEAHFKTVLTQLG